MYPNNADHVAVLDSTDNSLEFIDISGTWEKNRKFAGGCVAKNGKIVFAPYFAKGALRNIPFYAAPEDFLLSKPL